MAAGGDEEGALVEAKRQRTEDGAMVSTGGGGAALVKNGPQRTSELLAPIMLLSGHGAAVHTAKFSPDGAHLLSGSHDKTLLLWEVFGECRNLLTFKGHANAVLEAHWLDSELVTSASADKTAALWDVKTGGRVRLFRGHSSYVNSCCPSVGAPLLITGSDDCTARVWDTRSRSRPLIIRHPLPVTAVAASMSGNEMYTGGVDGIVRVYDLRQSDNEVLRTLTGHEDIITSLALSPNGHSLLSNAMDNTIRCWDVRPYSAVPDRCEKTFLGAQHNYEKSLIKCNWSPNGERVACGSSDQFVYVWDAMSRRILYKLPGHSGSVNEVAFHPHQPILASCGNDKNIYLGEIQE